MKFNPSPVLSVIAALGLIEVTSNAQYRNGTRMFFDPQTGVAYGSYSTGYSRRILQDGKMYPLNPREIKTQSFAASFWDYATGTHVPTGEIVDYKHKGYKRISDPIKRLELIARMVPVYRSHREKEAIA